MNSGNCSLFHRKMKICIEWMPKVSELEAHVTVLYTWVRALWIEFNNCFQQDATYSVYCISVGSSTCFGCWHPSSGAGTAVIAAVPARDDGYQQPKHVELPTEMQ